jgi:D-alanine--(R)-lactate ligase
MDKLRVAVLFGGCSEEHDISVKSALEIAQSLDTARFEPCFIHIDRGGAWRLSGAAGLWEAPGGAKGAPAIISPDRSDHGILVLQKDGYQKVHIDVALAVIHGKMGEDGQIQGLLEMSGIPYVGCDVSSSVLCMDKSLTYLVAQSVGVATPEFFVLDAEGVVEGAGATARAAGAASMMVAGAAGLTASVEAAGATRPAAKAAWATGVATQTTPEAAWALPAAAARLGYPVFVKPARSGSSFGVNKAHNDAELQIAVAAARRYDSKVLVEKVVSGREVGCAVLGNGKGLITGEIDLIALSGGFFKIHQEKHPESGSENATITVPADLPEDTSRRLKTVARRVYRALGCRGLARVDMFLQDDGSIVLNEVNTMPGCTSYSRDPAMMATAGINLPELINTLIFLALENRP